MASISVLSLNSFGIPFFLGYGRIRRLAAELNRLAPTVICLQEIQQNAYLPLLERELAAGSKFAHYHNTFAPKGGLFTASSPACTVIQSEFLPYPNQGRPFSIGFSDWWLNKGVLLLRLEALDRCFIIMNTHLQANYLGEWDISNGQARIQMDQVNYLVELVQAQPEDAWVVLCGDFNFPRQAPPYQQMISRTTLTDPLASDARSTYQPFPFIPGKAKWLITLDYMLYRAPAGDDLKATADILPVVNSSARRPLQRFLTDHQALILHIG